MNWCIYPFPAWLTNLRNYFLRNTQHFCVWEKSIEALEGFEKTTISLKLTNIRNISLEVFVFISTVPQVVPRVRSQSICLLLFFSLSVVFFLSKLNFQFFSPLFVVPFFCCVCWSKKITAHNNDKGSFAAYIFCELLKGVDFNADGIVKMSSTAIKRVER